jgi:hypothetical protein
VREEGKMLAELPPRLRARVLRRLYGGVLAALPAFDAAGDAAFLESLVRRAWGLGFWASAFE